MKDILFISLLTFGCIYASNGQCNISISEAEDGAMHYTAQKEKVYNDEMYDSGVLFASLQLEVWQHPTNAGLLQFYLYAWVVRKGNKPLVVPRKIKITFSDGSGLDLTADIAQDPRYMQGLTVYICEYNIHKENYLQLQNKSVSQITIIDNRTGENITCNPYPELLKEQANCIVNRLEKLK